MKDTIECKIPYDTADSVEIKVKKLREAQKLQKLNNVNYRLEVLNKLKDSFIKHEKDFHKSNFIDLGLTEFSSYLQNYQIVLNEINYAIKNLKSWASSRDLDNPITLPLASCYLKPEPYGLALIMSAWNCNFLTLIIPVVQAIAAGNYVIAKPATTSPETQKVCMKILAELPEDVLLCCAGKEDVREKLLETRFDLIIFTGSAKVGKIVAEKAARFLTPCILELGGQNPVVVEKSANINTACTNITFGRHGIFGQACIACEYCMVDKTIFDKFKEKLVEKYKELLGERPENSPDLGHIINERHYNRILNLIKNPGNGANLLYGGADKCFDERRFISPTIFSFDSLEAMKESNLAKEEIFGPVLYICPYEKLDQAIDYINSKEKPLVAHLFTSDKRIKTKFQEKTSSGSLLINDALVHFNTVHLPFGGVGNSGMGQYHGKFGFDHMSHMKPVLDNTNILFSFRYAPYTEWKKKFLKFICGYGNVTVGTCFDVVNLILVIAIFYLLYQIYQLKKLNDSLK